jgi:ketosteroid isomerase-like protein
MATPHAALDPHGAKSESRGDDMKAKELVAEFIQRCNSAASGAGGDPYELLAEDVDMSVQGRTMLAGEYPSREIVEKVLVGGVAPRVAKVNVEIDSIIGEGNKVATLLRTTGETTDGKIYNPKGQPGGCIFTVKGDEISQIRLFLDNTMVETVLLGRRYLPPSQTAEA